MHERIYRNEFAGVQVAHWWGTLLGPVESFLYEVYAGLAAAPVSRRKNVRMSASMMAPAQMRSA